MTVFEIQCHYRFAYIGVMGHFFCFSGRDQCRDIIDVKKILNNNIEVGNEVGVFSILYS